MYTASPVMATVFSASVWRDHRHAVRFAEGQVGQRRAVQRDVYPQAVPAFRGNGSALPGFAVHQHAEAAAPGARSPPSPAHRASSATTEGHRPKPNNAHFSDLNISIIIYPSCLCLLLGCVAFAEGASFIPGTYEGSGEGFAGPDSVHVTVTVDENAITEVVIEGEGELPMAWKPSPPTVESLIGRSRRRNRRRGRRHLDP